MEHKMLDIGRIISEQNAIMYAYDEKNKSPDHFMRFAMARTMKIYLLKKYALQEGERFTGRWDYFGKRKKVCSVCLTPMENARTEDGYCVICGALNG